ncbi:RHS repeat domain-containing protein [Saccharospirillum salsuginis]|uniref:Teneurin-like YD-shell domain-containing protein n=1 Tax=Saccharospirillum salsuginis TaxID=418750 RepID=A0A918KQL2_9GAMM|nr:RHS repeat-associated core domain-containing protein [Saccharospirillum salsuginis]GGX72906.1 hypothetical protein GCM10007392_45330 [Saccharospirillum salsuginis]
MSCYLKGILSKLMWIGVLASVAISAQASRETTYLHTDHLGTVVAATDESGSIVYRKQFDDYGDWLNTSSSVAENHPEGYTGKPLLEEAGLVYMGARFYDPEIGRFLSPDPVGFDVQEPMLFNKYLYGSNNPVLMVDPDGNRPVEYYRVEPTYSTVSAGHLKEFYGDHGFITSASTEEDERAVEFMENAIVGGVSMIPIMRGAQLAVNATRSIRAARGANSALKQFGRSVDDLSSAASQAINKEGLTAAARALTKHASGQRSSGSFPKLTGGIAEQNKAAREIVDEILGNSQSSFTNLSRGGLEVRAPDGRGLRYNSDGKLSGFLDPRK